MNAATPIQGTLSLGSPIILGDDMITGDEPDRSGIHAYLTMIRGPKDPERSQRPVGGRSDRAPHRTIAKTNPRAWHEPLLASLAEHGSSTFNALSVRILDKTADITCDTVFETALWRLVCERQVAFTMNSPVYFRLVTDDEL